jgi:hypothetical protein
MGAYRRGEGEEGQGGGLGEGAARGGAPWRGGHGGRRHGAAVSSGCSVLA